MVRLGASQDKETPTRDTIPSLIGSFTAGGPNWHFDSAIASRCTSTGSMHMWIGEGVFDQSTLTTYVIGDVFWISIELQERAACTDPDGIECTCVFINEIRTFVRTASTWQPTIAGLTGRNDRHFIIELRHEKAKYISSMTEDTLQSSPGLDTRMEKLSLTHVSSSYGKFM